MSPRNVTFTHLCIHTNTHTHTYINCPTLYIHKHRLQHTLFDRSKMKLSWPGMTWWCIHVSSFMTLISIWCIPINTVYVLLNMDYHLYTFVTNSFLLSCLVLMAKKTLHTQQIMLNDKKLYYANWFRTIRCCNNDDVTRHLTCDVYNRKDVSQSTFHPWAEETEPA